MLRTMLLAAVIGITTIGVSAPLEWMNLDDAHRVAGRKLSNGYMRGKVVLVCNDQHLAPRMEDVWESFKTKAFVLLGTFPSKVEDCTFPIYSDSGLAGASGKFPLYVVDETGHFYYRGENDHNAIQAVVMALGDTESPKNFKQFKKFLDWEIAETPGAAINRFVDFRKRFPEELRGYSEKERALNSLPDAKRIAELVAYSKKAKDFREFDPSKAQSQKNTFENKLKNALEKYAPLRNSEDPRIAQEAKNSLADIKIKLADL